MGVFFLVSVVVTTTIWCLTMYPEQKNETVNKAHSLAPENVNGKKFVLRFNRYQEICFPAVMEVDTKWTDHIFVIPCDDYDCTILFSENNVGEWIEEGSKVIYKKINNSVALLKFYPSGPYIVGLSCALLFFNSENTFTALMIDANNPRDINYDDSLIFAWTSYCLNVGISGIIHDYTGS